MLSPSADCADCPAVLPANAHWPALGSAKHSNSKPRSSSESRLIQREDCAETEEVASVRVAGGALTATCELSCLPISGHN